MEISKRLHRREAAESTYLVLLSPLARFDYWPPAEPIGRPAITIESTAPPQASRAAIAAPAFPSKADLEAELAAEQQAAAAAATVSPSIEATRGNNTTSSSHGGNGEESGPSELTLIAYSAFMGLSSLLFGGLTLLQAKNAGGLTGEQAKPMTIKETLLQGLVMMLWRIRDVAMSLLSFVLGMESQTLVMVVMFMTIVVTVAYSTKPSDASFCSYLTDLSLHQHLRRIQDGQQKALALSKSLEASSANGSSSPDRLQDWSTDQASPHASTFANRISISLRTPPYVRHDYALFSLISVTHPCIPCIDNDRDDSTTKSEQSSGPCRRCGAADVSCHRPRSSWFIGVFGGWWHGAQDVLDLSTVTRHKEQQNLARRSACEWGVLDMQSLDEDDKRRRSSAKSDRLVGGSESPADDITVANLPQNKAARRKKHPQRTRPVPPTSTLATARSTAVSQRKASETGHPTNRSDGSTLQTAIQSCSDQAKPSTAQTARTAASDPASATAQPDALVATEAANSELKSQLAHVKSTSEQTRQRLQAQLDELKSQKNEEDTARTELKSKTKVLDEGKRTTEAAKREAERKLKAAQGVREALQKRIDASNAALESFKERESGAQKHLEETLQNGSTRRQEIEKELESHKAATVQAEADLQTWTDKLEPLQQRVSQVQEELKAAEQSVKDKVAMRRQAAAAAATTSAAAGFAQMNQANYGSYTPEGYYAGPYADASPQLYPGPGSHSSGRREDSWGPHDGQAFLQNPYSRQFGPSHRRASESEDSSQMLSRDGEFQPFGAASTNRSFVTPYDSQRHGAPQASGFHSTGPLDDGVSGALPATHTPRQPRSLVDLNGAYAGSGNTGIPPPSPFSTDLLPSNLFQSADDETHQGDMLSRQPSDRYQAALGQLGLESTSDVEATQSDRDATVDEVLAAGLHPLSEHESEDEQLADAGAAQAAAAKSSRSWWSTGRSRQQSKDKQAIAAAAADDSDAGLAEDEGDGSVGQQPDGKRRSFGLQRLFSGQAGQAGAKNQRSASSSTSRKQSDIDGLRSTGMTGFRSNPGFALSSPSSQGADRPVDWSTTSLGSGEDFYGSNRSDQTHGTRRGEQGSDYDRLKRAFEIANAPDEEEGRRSWSAFEQWNHSQHRAFAPHAVSPLAGSAARLGAGEEPANASSTSSAAASRHQPTSSGGSFNQWPQDLFQPLDRSTSAGQSIHSSSGVSSIPDQSIGSLSATSSPNQTQRPNKSRFAFWNSQNSKASLNSTGSKESSGEQSSSVASPGRSVLQGASSAAQNIIDGGSTKSTSASLGTSPNAGVLSSSLDSGSSQAPSSASKSRRSFRWTRRPTGESKSSGGAEGVSAEFTEE